MHDRAPSASARAMSCPERMPPSNITSISAPTASTIGGKAEDKETFMKALKEAKVPNTLRGPVRFDELGNVVGNIYLRKVEKKDGRYVNAVIKTYPDVSQFWTYKQDEFLKNPVYSRDYPPAKNLEP